MIYNQEFYESELKRALLSPRKLAKVVLTPENDKDAYKRIREIGSNIESFVNNGNNLMIWSRGTGTGKTLLATKLAQKYIARRNSNTLATDCAVFISVGDLLTHKHNSWNHDLYSQERILELEEKIRNCKLVVWDDIGTRGMSYYDQEYLIVLLNHRLNDLHKSNIYTSNLDSEQLYEVVGARLFSRLREDTEIIELKGGDKR